MRHDQVGKLLYNAIIRKHHKDHPYVFGRPVWTSDVLEIWWDIKIETSPSVASNKPDIVVWNKTEKICSIIEIWWDIKIETLPSVASNKPDIVWNKTVWNKLSKSGGILRSKHYHQ